MIRLAIAALVLGLAADSRAQSPPDRSLDAVLQKMGAYVDRYGERASLFVAVEKYVQQIDMGRPRQLVSGFAIVRTPAGWVGFRDVVEVNGRKLSDRRDWLQSILTDLSADTRLALKLSDESARYNIGPIIVPQ